MLRLMILGCLLILSLSSFLFPSAAQVTHPSEVKALRAVKSNLIDAMKFLRNWNDGDPCTSNWTGILCLDTIGADRYRHVWGLQLLNMNLSGALSPEVGQLSQLEILDFMWNDLTGTIPKEIGNLKSLRLLLLNGNSLSGSLPEELGYLKNLTRLQVDQNQISGPVPKSFGNLSAIRHIHLNNNSISGQIPHELASLPTLLHLLLDTNNLSGSLPPEFSSLPELRIIQLDNNNFSGAEIPATYGNFSRLIKLSLRNCSLQGAIPDFSRIPNLSYLDLSLNHLTGSIPSNKLSDNITTIVLSDNRINGSIPGSFANLPLLQTLLLENNLLNGSFPTNIWQNISFDTNARLTIDLRNNSISAISGDLKPPVNVTLRFSGNPICNNANTPNINQYCESEPVGEVNRESLTNSTCPVQACPTDNFYEYVPESPVQCFCASPLRIGYRLKSPSFSYFPPYLPLFETYVTDALNLELYQLSIDSYSWEAGPRVGMYLKLFPRAGNANSSTFNTSEVHRIRERFMTWNFRGSDLFGPYELLNFTLLGPYSDIDLETQGTSIGKGILAAIILGSIASAIATTAIITILITRRTRYRQISSRKHISSKISIRIDNVKSFTFKEMAMATNNFDSSTQVGQGGYGKVYRGTLSDKTVVAIKRAEEGSLQGEKEFLTEIELLSRLHHRNLVALLGYCDEEGEQMLVYEFMPNGTLRDWLKAKAKGDLSFGMRLSIALGSAKGILYLHTEAQPPIFHRDIKASNILLDAKFTVKVADFGLSRLAPVPDDQGDVPNYVSTMVRGTPGYLDPEYFLTHKLTDKSDVYSLGVVLLELLTGMQPITHGKNIVREANVAHKSGMMFSIVDSRMGSYPSQCLERFAALALDCCHDKPEKRPSMIDVVRELENILKMLPENDVFSESSSTSTKFSGSKSATSSSNYVSRDQYVSSNVSGSDLVSGVVPTISPR